MLGESNSDILFKKSLRSGQKSHKSIKRSMINEQETLQKLLISTLQELKNNDRDIQYAINLVTEEHNLLKNHISFQLFIPEAKTNVGERLLHEQHIWIITLVVFHALCNEHNKYSQYLLRNVENSLHKYFQDYQSIQQQVSQILDASNKINIKNSSQKEKQLKKVVQFIDETKENQTPKSIKNSIQKENIFNQSNIKINQQEEIQVEKLIDQQVKELEEDIQNKRQIRKRQSLTEKLFTAFGLKAWKSEIKQDVHHPTLGIRLFNGLDSRELHQSIIVNIEKFIDSNINDNGLHAIVQLSIDNPQEILNWGKYAIIQLNQEPCTSQQYLEDMKYYETLIAYRFKQERKIYIPFGKYLQL